jgi:hypothetical protein
VEKTYEVTVITVMRIRAKGKGEARKGGERIIRESLPYGIPRERLTVEYPIVSIKAVV